MLFRVLGRKARALTKIRNLGRYLVRDEHVCRFQVAVYERLLGLLVVEVHETRDDARRDAEVRLAPRVLSLFEKVVQRSVLA